MFRVNASDSLYNGLCPSKTRSTEKLNVQSFSQCQSRDAAGQFRGTSSLQCNLLQNYDTGMRH